MSIETGFWSSNNHDRQYSADDLNGMFDGIVDSGVFETIGTHFEVTATTGNTINVGIGKCRFNKHTLNNTALLPLTLDDSEVALGRIDAVVVEINDSDTVRSGSIKIVNGTASSTPVRPTMTDVGDGVKGVHQYALAYITRAAASSSIVTADITNVVGEEATPYISGMSGSGVEVGPTAPSSPTAKSWVDTSVGSESGTFTDFFDQYTTDKGREYGQLVDDVEELKNIITCEYSTSIVRSSGEVIPLNTISSQIGDKLTLYNNRIVIGSGISKVLISGVVAGAALDATHYIQVYIMHNSTPATELINCCGVNASGSYWGSVSLAPRILNVVEGDTIWLKALNGMQINASISSKATYLTVQAIC